MKRSQQRVQSNRTSRGETVAPLVWLNAIIATMFTASNRSREEWTLSWACIFESLKREFLAITRFCFYLLCCVCRSHTWTIVNSVKFSYIFLISLEFWISLISRLPKWKDKSSREKNHFLLLAHQSSKRFNSFELFFFIRPTMWAVSYRYRSVVFVWNEKLDDAKNKTKMASPVLFSSRSFFIPFSLYLACTCQ